MKLNYPQLEPHLSKQLAPAYIISGEELLLKQDAITLIRKAAKLAGYSERIHITPEAGYDWEQLHTILHSNSLFAEKRLIEIDFRDIAPNKVASGILKEYGEHVSSNNLLVLDIGKLDDKVTKSAWYKSLEKVGIVISIWPIPREQLPQWIIGRAKRYKLQFNLDAANLLADYIEGNLVAAAQSIEKIYLLQPQKQVDIELITTILTDESHFTVFDFIESLIASDKTRALHILESLRNEGTEPVLILWAITRELRMLSDMAQQLKQGQTCESLLQKYRIFMRRQNVVRHFLKKFSAEHCWELLAHTTIIDRTIKGAAPGNVWDAFQLFCLRFV